jgi:hypothetical protein
MKMDTQADKYGEASRISIATFRCGRSEADLETGYYV